MAIRTPVITEVREDEEQQPQPSIASRPVASFGSMAPNTRAEHKYNANKDNTRSTTKRPSPNHVATFPRINGDPSLPTPSSSNPSLRPSPVILGSMEKAASDSEGLLRLATDGTVSSGNLEGLFSRVIADIMIEDPSGNDHFRTTFLTIYQLFATSERLFHILRRRFESSELDSVPARSRYPYVNNALPLHEY
jgi:hypothetical protein